MFTQFLKITLYSFRAKQIYFFSSNKKIFFFASYFEDLKLTKKKQFIYFLIFFYHLVGIKRLSLIYYCLNLINLHNNLVTLACKNTFITDAKFISLAQKNEY